MSEKESNDVERSVFRRFKECAAEGETESGTFTAEDGGSSSEIELPDEFLDSGEPEDEGWDKASE